MIQANTNNRLARLSQSEKAELFGIYASKGYHDLASIIAHYNSCGGKLHGNGGPGKVTVPNPEIIRNSVRGMIPTSVLRAISHYGTRTYDKDNLQYINLNYDGSIGNMLKDLGKEDDWDAGETFLYDPVRQKLALEKKGYHYVDDGDYGLVSSSVDRLSSILGGKKIPIYQIGEDEISRDRLTPIPGSQDELQYLGYRDEALKHAGSYPTALYLDKDTGDYYIRSWDLNDYGQHDGKKHGSGNHHKAAEYGTMQILADIYDYIGNPFVQRSGLKKIPKEWVSGLKSIPIIPEIEPDSFYLGELKPSVVNASKMDYGGNLFDNGGGKFLRINLQDQSPYPIDPRPFINYPIETPYRFRPEPDLGDYESPVETGMIQSIPVPIYSAFTAPQPGYGVLEPEPELVVDLFSDEAKARRRLKQAYAESGFRKKAQSKAGAKGLFQIMDITHKDYLGRGSGKSGDIYDPEYNGGIRDWVMSIIPRDLKEFWSDSDSDRAKLAKLYAAYNWGAGNLRNFLRKKRDAGVDISNPDNWVDDLNPETRRYVKYLAFDEDIPDSIYTNSAFEESARKNGYMAEGGRLFEMGGPEKQNWLTRATMNAMLNGDPAVATAAGWTRDKEGNVVQTEQDIEGVKKLRETLAEIAAMPLTDLVVDIAGAAVIGTKTYKAMKLARELNKMLKAGEFDAAVDMAREASKAKPIVKASTTLPAGYPSSSDYSLTRVPSSLPITEQPANLVSLPNYAGQVEDAIKAGKWGNLSFYRNIDGVPYTADSGLIRLGKDENALVNVTSDLPFRLHGNYKAAPGAEYLVIDPEAFVGKTPLSIEPMDTFFPNVGMDIDPKYVKIITGNKGIIPEIEAKGMEVLTSPELQELYSKIGGDFGSEAAAMYRDAVDKYITENLGRPSLADYAHLEEVTGLKSGTVPLSEQEAYNAAKQASKEIEATYDWMSKMGLDSSKYVRGLSDDIRWPYTYANGRDVSAISFSEEPIIGAGGNVFYDTAPRIEAGLMESLGSYSHPDMDRLDSILEYTLDPNGYHYFDPQIGRQGFILPTPIRKDGGRIHIKPENRGKFTALKKRTGHSASWFKAHGTPAQKKMATFALNARKWKHGDGGALQQYADFSGLF